MGVTLLTAGGLSLVNTNEDDWFGVLGLVLIGSACYCLGVAAVARGIQLSRK